MLFYRACELPGSACALLIIPFGIVLTHRVLSCTIHTYTHGCHRIHKSLCQCAGLLFHLHCKVICSFAFILTQTLALELSKLQSNLIHTLYCSSFSCPCILSRIHICM